MKRRDFFKLTAAAAATGVAGYLCRTYGLPARPLTRGYAYPLGPDTLCDWRLPSKMKMLGPGGA
jgi:hypothetical protein